MRVKNIDGQIVLVDGRKRLSIESWLNAVIGNKLQFAERSGVDRNSIQLLCAGRRQLGHLKFLKVLAALGAEITIPEKI
ncbi:MAG: hypothetical protein LLF76_08070 [Planctomycetaceae bacterium]|nr:hypothetical protein [Planctomycetaceae bacterium]